MAEKLLNCVQRTGCTRPDRCLQEGCCTLHYSEARPSKRESPQPESAEYWLGEILAVMHGDGGHYRAQHGNQKATEDAIAKWYARSAHETSGDFVTLVNELRAVRDAGRCILPAQIDGIIERIGGYRVPLPVKSAEPETGARACGCPSESQCIANDGPAPSWIACRRAQKSGDDSNG